MVVIRLARGGAKNSPFYHVVVTTKANPRDSRFIERIGYYNPAARGKAIPLELNHDRINYWVAKGAKLSDRVTLIIKNQKMQAAKTESTSK